MSPSKPTRPAQPRIPKTQREYKLAKRQLAANPLDRGSDSLRRIMRQQPALDGSQDPPPHPNTPKVYITPPQPTQPPPDANKQRYDQPLIHPDEEAEQAGQAEQQESTPAQDKVGQNAPSQHGRKPKKKKKRRKRYLTQREHLIKKRPHTTRLDKNRLRAKDYVESEPVAPGIRVVRLSEALDGKDWELLRLMQQKPLAEPPELAEDVGLKALAVRKRMSRPIFLRAVINLRKRIIGWLGVTAARRLVKLLGSITDEEMAVSAYATVLREVRLHEALELRAIGFDRKAKADKPEPPDAYVALVQEFQALPEETRQRLAEITGEEVEVLHEAKTRRVPVEEAAQALGYLVEEAGEAEEGEPELAGENGAEVQEPNDPEPEVEP